MININIKRGDSISFTLTFVDVNEDIINLNNYDNIYADISSSPTHPTQTIKLTLGNRLEINNDNILVIKLTSKDTFKLDKNRYYSDVKVKKNDDEFTIASITYNVNSTSTNLN
ncbi:hypothetical protein MM236_01180 [Belliella sp. DSM 107340]|uniref:Uncharacterized protein n=1 Tax=Belliella calami TaxID=2923436 RepID=A0ABS9UIX9_9BACT|nr:hypothetical protein [Belliella calami]MCH7396574.1 hypothetical protein [Belliella calami]